MYAELEKMDSASLEISVILKKGSEENRHMETHVVYYYTYRLSLMENHCSEAKCWIVAV